MRRSRYLINQTSIDHKSYLNQLVFIIFVCFYLFIALYLSPKVQMKTPITSGDWEVMNAQIACHYEFGLIFFMGLKDSPIERHLYVASLRQPGEIRRLTKLGFSYSAFFNADCTLGILTYSSTKKPPACLLHRISYTDSSIHGVRIEPLTYFTETPRQ